MDRRGAPDGGLGGTMFNTSQAGNGPGGAESGPVLSAPWCRDGGTVAVIGGGPAGAFFALHALRKAGVMGVSLRVILLERQWQPGGAGLGGSSGWKGCNHCAGGLSPRLFDVLGSMGLELPKDLVQSEIESISIQGYWKNIELEVPPGRRMASVYRGSRPARRADRNQTFDLYLLEQACAAGAEVIEGEVWEVRRSEGARPVICYRAAGGRQVLEADFVVFAAGMNGEGCAGEGGSGMVRMLEGMIPGYRAPRLRRALVFELESKPELPPAMDGQLHFVEYGSRELQLEMCSLVPKRGFITVVLVGASVDAAGRGSAEVEILRQFLDLPHIHKLLGGRARLETACACHPAMVVRTARRPFGDRVAAIGDMATSRLYKDGILSAHRTAEALAETLLTRGCDQESLEAGYGPVIRQFRRDNRFAAVVFLLHRIFFGSSFLSRVLYQAVLTERKALPRQQRRLERLLWLIASGDAHYEKVFWALLHPSTLGSILVGGLFITLRNMVTELLFGLRWQGFGRFTTGVERERLEAKRGVFSRLLAEAGMALPSVLEFERMYTVRIFASADRVMEQLGRFGEADRRYFRPRWVRVERVAGRPNQPGCVIRYFIGSRHLSFGLVLERQEGSHVSIYRVVDGFARGGVLIFDIEQGRQNTSDLSIYVAFAFARGRRWLTRPFWWGLRCLFPAFVHDVLWNHSLCTLKDVAEIAHQEAASAASS